MLTVEEAQRAVIEACLRRPSEVASLGPQLLGLVLAEDVSAPADMPPFDKSLVDGYAVRTEDFSPAPAELTVVEEITAGRPPERSLAKGQTARIMTGAMLPAGADAVVMIERSELLSDERVRLNGQAPKPEQNVLRRGREMRRGDSVLQEGTVLRPQEIGTLAGLGKTRLRVYPPAAVAVLATGDELVEPDEEPGPGQIRNSNVPMLMAQVERAGAKALSLGIARDTRDSLAPLIAEGLKADVLLLSGGVSAGKLDLVPDVLKEQGVEPIFHKIAMKPGKPLFFGTKDETLVFGLPGNPVSSLVGFELFVRPALRLLMGHPAGTELLSACLAVDFAYSTDRPTYHPARLSSNSHGWTIEPVPWFGSADLRAISRANAFVLFAVGDNRYKRGDMLRFLPTDIYV